MVDDSIYERLSTFTGITDLVGTNIWKIEVPEASTPQPSANFSALVFMRVSDTSEQSVDGDALLNTARFQFSCFSNISPRQARLISIQLRLALQGYHGGEIMASSFAGGGMDLYESEDRMHHIPVDFFITYTA